MITESTHSPCFQPQQATELLDLGGQMANPDGAVVRRALPVPFLDKPPGAQGKTIAAVGVADLEDRAGDRLPLGDLKLEPTIHSLND